jgi:hypothetical protein
MDGDGDPLTDLTPSMDDQVSYDNFVDSPAIKLPVAKKARKKIQTALSSDDESDSPAASSSKSIKSLSPNSAKKPKKAMSKKAYNYDPDFRENARSKAKPVKKRKINKLASSPVEKYRPIPNHSIECSFDTSQVPSRKPKIKAMSEDDICLPSSQHLPRPPKYLASSPCQPLYDDTTSELFPEDTPKQLKSYPKSLEDHSSQEITYHIIAKDPCPVERLCTASVSKPYSPALSKAYKHFLKAEKAFRSHKVGREVYMSARDRFCSLHEAEKTIIPDGKKKGYKGDIKFDLIPRRLKKMKAELAKVLDPTFPSRFRDRIRALFAELGTMKAQCIFDSHSQPNHNGADE